MTEIVFEHADFDFGTLEEELKVDEQCCQLLHQFYLWLQQLDLTPEHASELAYSTDYYLRDYVLDFLRLNVLRPLAGQLRYFAANWYITRTLEPEMSVLVRHLEGIVWLYRYLLERNLIGREELTQIEQEAADHDYYQQRIKAFLALAGEGYEEWDRECSFDTVKRGLV